LKYRLQVFLAVFLIMTLTALPGSAVGASLAEETLETVVRMDPMNKTAAVGDVFTVDVWVDDVSQLYGADIQLAFDPTVFEVQDANPYEPGVQITLRSDLLQPDIVLHNDADNSTGTVWYVVAQMNPTGPASGSGVLFEFDLRAKSTATSLVSFTNIQLSNKDAEPIDFIYYDAVYTIEESAQPYYSFLPLVVR
jgi:hypothetical protein